MEVQTHYNNGKELLKVHILGEEELSDCVIQFVFVKFHNLLSMHRLHSQWISILREKKLLYLNYVYFFAFE